MAEVRDRKARTFSYTGYIFPGSCTSCCMLDGAVVAPSSQPSNLQDVARDVLALVCALTVSCTNAGCKYISYRRIELGTYRSP